MPCFRQIL